MSKFKNYKVIVLDPNMINPTIFYTGDEQHKTSNPDCSDGFYRFLVITEIVDNLHETLCDFSEAVITLNGDIVIVDQDDVESGVVAVVKEVMAV